MKIAHLLTIATLAISSLAIADSDYLCTTHSKTEWVAGSDAHAKIVAMGYKVKEFKESGNCYKIEGWDKNGQKVDVYFDPKTLAVVRSKIDH
ncbi:PepSY domain-containing protein [Iodobacter ciconiae]|uniref:PepSY domain-containing protein n=1 Tax=Iodobacter ciconiae TaxID=2496266 RepID=A0A3S8ZUC2_9NEIS|nr:PepSY domain-containing protein [Iodobacter ciconiae]AZN37107.1 PepSY domain-containing protein [Iodobacter ciconiae]